MVANSVIHTDLNIVLRDEQQKKALVEWLNNSQIQFHYEVNYGLSETGHQWEVTIHDVPWGVNIKSIGEVLTAIDFQVYNND